MSDTSLAGRLVRAADEFPNLDALVIYRPDLRDAHAAEQAKNAPDRDPARVVESLSDLTPQGAAPMQLLRSGEVPCWPLKVCPPLAPDDPRQSKCAVQLYDDPKWMIHLYGWSKADGPRTTRLVQTLCVKAAETLVGSERAKGDTWLSSWFIYLAERDPRKQLVELPIHPLFGKSFLPTWRQATAGDPWWLVFIKNVLDVSAKAVQQFAHGAAAPADTSSPGITYQILSRGNPTRVRPPTGGASPPRPPSVAPEYSYQIIPAPDDFPPPEGGGAYAIYKENKDAKGILVAVWGVDTPEPWHVDVIRDYPGVGFGQPCPWNMGWLPGCWEFSVFPLCLTARHIWNWLHVAGGVVRQAVNHPDEDNGSGNRNWHAMIRAARILADRFGSRSASLCGTPLPLSPTAALAEMEAHHDAIISALEKRGESDGAPRNARELSQVHLAQCQKTVQHWQGVIFGNADGISEWNPNTLRECIDRLHDLDNMITYWRAWYTNDIRGSELQAYHPTGARCVFNQLLKFSSHLTRFLAVPLPHEEIDLSTMSHFRAACDDLQVFIRVMMADARHQTPIPPQTFSLPADTAAASAHPSPGPKKGEEDLPAGDKPDGPEDGVRVRFDGKLVDLTGRLYAVAAFMWGRESATIDALKGAVGEEVQDATVHTWMTRVNNALAPLMLPWTLTADKVNRVVRKRRR